jgi:hypothetical protein
MTCRRLVARFFIVFCALILMACSPSSSVPPICDPLGFVNDCGALLSKPLGQIDSSKWPESIRVLQPVSVEHGTGTIKIITFRGEGEDCRGYIVYPLVDLPADQAKEGGPHWKVTQRYAFIYSFEYVP